jgi:hypothetical protein
MLCDVQLLVTLISFSSRLFTAVMHVFMKCDTLKSYYININDIDIM